MNEERTEPAEVKQPYPAALKFHDKLETRVCSACLQRVPNSEATAPIGKHYVFQPRTAEELEGGHCQRRFTLVSLPRANAET